VLGRLGRLAARHPWPILAVAALFVTVAVLFGGSAAAHLSPGGFTDPGAQSTRAGEALSRVFHAEGTPADLKDGVGLAHLMLVIPAAGALARAAEVLAGQAAGPIRRLPGAGRLDVPVVPRPGLVTDVIRLLDSAGVDVDDVALRRPSLDDVFHALTRPQARAGAGRALSTEPADPGPPAVTTTGEQAA
jgi:hypothetical protein